MDNAVVLRLQLLGPPRLVHGDGRSTALERHDAALLARLALDGPCRRDVLAAWLWPQADTEHAHSNLRQRLSRLRRAAGARLFAGSDPLALHADVRHDHDAGVLLPTLRLLQGCEFDDHDPIARWIAAADARLRRHDAPRTALPVERRAPDLRLLRPPRTVGRGTELAALQQIVDDGRVALLLGEPGIGKSRLVTEFAAARPGTLVIGCRPGDEPVPYALLARVLRALPDIDTPPDALCGPLQHLLPDRGAPPPGPLQPLQLAAAITWALRQGGAGARTIAVDDRQYADPASLESLLPLLADGDTRWLLAARAAEVPALLQSWLAQAGGIAAQTLALAPLDRAALHELLVSLDAGDNADANSLHRHTGGNPLFVLRALIERDGGDGTGAALPVPESVLALLARRMGRLDSDAAALLHVAALAGQDFDVELACAVRGTTAPALADAWRTLEAARLLDGERLAHDLVAEAAARAVPRATAPALHAAIAAHLADHGGALPRVARHWQQAGRWPEAGRAFMAAAERIGLQLRQAEAAELLRDAVQCFQSAHDVDREADAWHTLYRANWSRKRRQGLRDCAAGLQALQERSASAHVRLRALEVLATLGFDERADDEALALMRQTRQLARELGNDALALYMSGWLAGSLAVQNRPADALAEARLGLPWVETAAVTTQSNSALTQFGITHEICGHPLAALPLLHAAERRQRAIGDDVHANDTLGHQSVCGYHLGRLADAAHLIERCRAALAAQNGGRAEPHTSDVYQSRFWREQGRLADALALMGDVHRRIANAGEANLRGNTAVELGRLYLLLGQPHRARPLLAAGHAAPKPEIRTDALLLEAQLAQAAGHSAAVPLQQALTLTPRCPRSERWRWRIELELAREQPADEAAARLDANLAVARERAILSAALPTQLLLADTLRRAGRLDAALAHAAALHAELQRGQAPLALAAAEYALLLARVFEASGDLATALAVARVGTAQLRAHQVPPEFALSFAERQASNHALHRLAARLEARA